MNVCGSQTYLKTRVRILAGRLFSDRDIAQFIDMPMSELMSRFSLDSILREAGKPQQNSQMLERSQLHILMLEFTLLLRPLTRKARELLLYWAHKLELYNLKTLIRGKLNDLDIDTIRDDLYELPEYLRLPHESLLRAENIQEMLRMLERGLYASIARQARHVYEEKNEPFSLDAAIDRLYYAGLLRYVEQSVVSDQPGLQRLVSSLIDRQNILWLLRYRFAYDFPPSKAYYLLVPLGGRIGRKQLMRLANLQGFDALLGNLPAPYFQLLDGLQNGMQVRQRLDHHVSSVAQRLIRQSPCAVVAALSYLVAREKDLRRLFAIIRGRLLELDKAVIEEAVIGPVDNKAMESA